MKKLWEPEQVGGQGNQGPGPLSLQPAPSPAPGPPMVNGPGPGPSHNLLGFTYNFWPGQLQEPEDLFIPLPPYTPWSDFSNLPTGGQSGLDFFALAGNPGGPIGLGPQNPYFYDPSIYDTLPQRGGTVSFVGLGNLGPAFGNVLGRDGVPLRGISPPVGGTTGFPSSLPATPANPSVIASYGNVPAGPGGPAMGYGTVPVFNPLATVGSPPPPAGMGPPVPFAPGGVLLIPRIPRGPGGTRLPGLPFSQPSPSPTPDFGPEWTGMDTDFSGDERNLPGYDDDVDALYAAIGGDTGGQGGIIAVNPGSGGPE